MSKEVFEQNLPHAFNVDLSNVFDNQDPNDGFIDDSKPLEDTTPLTDGDDNLEGLKTQEDTTETADPYADYSDFAKIALLDAKEGFLTFDEKEIPKDIDALGFRDLYRKTVEKELELEKQRFFDQAGEAAEYLKVLLEGGDPDDVGQMLRVDEILKLDISDTENQKLLIKTHLLDLGVPQVDVDELVENTLDKGNGATRAQQALDFYKKSHDELLESNKRAIQEQQLAQEEFTKKVSTEIKTIIDSGNIGGYAVDKNIQSELYDAIFKPTERIEYQDQYGRTVSTRVPKIEILSQKIRSDIPTYVSYALWLLKGGNFDFAKAQGKNEGSDDLRQLLEGKKAVGGPNVKKTENNQVNNYPKRAVFEYNR